MSEFIELLGKRRSVRSVAAEISVSDDALTGLLRRLVAGVPSAYDMRSQRLVLLMGDAHKQLWDIVEGALKPLTPPERFVNTQKKLAGFAGGHGTLLFFDDAGITAKFKADNAQYAENFDRWVLEQNGMLQMSAWMLLTEQGLGASLQHYNPLIDDAVKARWGLPDSWRLLAQMPFGAPVTPPAAREPGDVDGRMRVFK